uniref:RING-type E3 ubiquitin transferase n=1 Tax=Amphilophus citrinellus TaxID=61819 RepID=A0A3Q0T5Q8_AMPCI
MIEPKRGSDTSHRFCFPCIQEWSHKKPECPLCKQPFTSIFHRNHAEDDFKEYSLRPAPASRNRPFDCSLSSVFSASGST